MKLRNFFFVVCLIMLIIFIYPSVILAQDDFSNEITQSTASTPIVSPNGLYVAIAMQTVVCDVKPDFNTIEIREVTTNDLVQTLVGHTCGMTIFWSPDSSRLASASGDGTFRIWNTLTGEQLVQGPFQSQYSSFNLSWNADSSRLAIISDVVVNIYNTQT